MNQAEESVEHFAIKKHVDQIGFPVGNGHTANYYIAQGYGDNNHLGEDWNGKGGGNTDLGDSIYSVATGYVKSAKNYGAGWGNVIRIVHFLHDQSVVESLYAHCDSIVIKQGDWVEQGEFIGTIGNVDGLYAAHLHFEMRSDTSLNIGHGYGAYNEGYLSPSLFIENFQDAMK